MCFSVVTFLCRGCQLENPCGCFLALARSAEAKSKLLHRINLVLSITSAFKCHLNRKTHTFTLPIFYSECFLIINYKF